MNNESAGVGKNHTIVIVDDEEIVRYTLRKKLAKFGYKVISLDKGEDALYLLKNAVEPVDFLITDIKLRKMDGIELLRHISSLDSPVPVLLTGHGNVEDAVKALRYGACDFIKKPVDANQVASIIRHVLKVREEERKYVNLGRFSVYEKREFLIPNDPELANLLAFELTKNLSGIGLCNKSDTENILLALREAMSNAIYHGNLEVSSDLRENDGGVREFNEEVERRMDISPYKERRVKVQYELTNEFVVYVIIDDVPGFNFSSLPDPKDPENFFKKSGRGILIIKIHMDEVEWRSPGNYLRLKKYRVDTDGSNKMEW
jgi:CheY-like chemotaxis protein